MSDYFEHQRTMREKERRSRLLEDIFGYFMAFVFGMVGVTLLAAWIAGHVTIVVTP